MQDEGNKNLKSQTASQSEGGNGKDKSKVEAKVWDIIAKIARATSKAEIDMLVGDALVLIANNGLPQNLIYNLLRTAEESKYIATGKDVGTFTNAWQANMAAIAAAELQAFYKEVKDLKSQEKAIMDKLSTESDFKALMEGTPEQAKQAAIALSQKNNEPPSVAFNGIIQFIKGLDQKIEVEKEELRKEKERGEESAAAIRLARIAAYEAQRESAMAGAAAEMDRRRAVQVAIDKVGPITAQSTPEQVQSFKNWVVVAEKEAQKDPTISRELIEGVVKVAIPGKPMDPVLANKFDEDVKKIVAKDAESLKGAEMAMFEAMAGVAPESPPPSHNQGAVSRQEQSSQNIASGNEQAMPKPSAPPQAEVLGQQNVQLPANKVPEVVLDETPKPKKKSRISSKFDLEIAGIKEVTPESKSLEIPVPSTPSQSEVQGSQNAQPPVASATEQPKELHAKVHAEEVIQAPGGPVVQNPVNIVADVAIAEPEKPRRKSRISSKFDLEVEQAAALAIAKPELKSVEVTPVPSVPPQQDQLNAQPAPIDKAAEAAPAESPKPRRKSRISSKFDIEVAAETAKEDRKAQVMPDDKPHPLKDLIPPEIRDGLNGKGAYKLEEHHPGGPIKPDIPKVEVDKRQKGQSGERGI